MCAVNCPKENGRQILMLEPTRKHHCREVELGLHPNPVFRYLSTINKIPLWRIIVKSRRHDHLCLYEAVSKRCTANVVRIGT